jgi:hypothetical protein
VHGNHPAHIGWREYPIQQRRINKEIGKLSSMFQPFSPRKMLEGVAPRKITTKRSAERTDRENTV